MRSGTGTMRRGIAHICAQAGYQVSLADINDQFLQIWTQRAKGFLHGSVREKS